MQLVILAAGHGRRFGGLKQLAPVGPHGEAIMDYTALAAEACGYEGIVLVVRESIVEEVAEHVRRSWPRSLPVEFVCQRPIPGTAEAVHAARTSVHGPFGVANADDLYGQQPLQALIDHFARPESEEVAQRHVLVAYQLLRTILTGSTVTRGLVQVGEDRRLERIVEHAVTLKPDGTFDAVAFADTEADPRRDGAGQPRIELHGDEQVSMNLWGFHRRFFAEVDAAITAFDPERSPRPELLLPDVVGHLVAHSDDDVQVVETNAYCIGITHREDIAIVHDELVLDLEDDPLLRVVRGV